MSLKSSPSLLPVNKIHVCLLKFVLFVLSYLFISSVALNKRHYPDWINRFVDLHLFMLRSFSRSQVIILRLKTPIKVDCILWIWAAFVFKFLNMKYITTYWPIIDHNLSCVSCVKYYVHLILLVDSTRTSYY